MRQIQQTRRQQAERDAEIDVRTPSGRSLPL
jgi:hypothetical protein